MCNVMHSIYNVMYSIYNVMYSIYNVMYSIYNVLNVREYWIMDILQDDVTTV